MFLGNLKISNQVILRVHNIVGLSFAALTQIFLINETEFRKFTQQKKQVALNKKTNRTKQKKKKNKK